MFKKIKEEKKYLFLLFFLITLVSLMYFFPSISKNVPVTFGTDIKPQWFEFYAEFRNLMSSFIHNGELPFYSWNMFLGNNFWASKSYYLIGDVYNYIGLLSHDNFFDIARNLSYLKFLVSGFSFYLFLTEVGCKPKSKLITSLAYAFSGWAIFFSGQLVFLSFYSFIPFYLLGIELCLKNKKPFVFIIACALLFSTNFYFFYTLTLFSPIFYIYRYFVLGLDKKHFWRCVFKQILYYIAGIMITAVFWLPGVVYILDSNRFVGNSDKFDIFVYLNFLISSFIPNYLYIYRNNAFETSVHYSREICIWSSSILIVLLPQFFSMTKEKIEKILTISVYIIFALIAVNPKLCSAMHGFGDPSFRWVFLIVIFNLYLIARILDNYEKIDNKLLLKTLLFIITFVLCLFALELCLRNANLIDYKKNFLIIIVSIIFMILGYFVIKKRNQLILLALVTIEIGLSGMYCYGQDVYSKPNDTYDYMYDLTHVIQDYPGEIMEKINSLEANNPNEFIRLYIPHDSIYWNFSHNMSLHYGIKGLMTYDSTYANSFVDMYHMVPSVSEFGSGWIFNIKDDDLMSFLSTKYAIVSSSDQLSEQWELVDDDFHYGFKIYKNKNYRPLGITYNSIMTIPSDGRIEDTSLFLNNVIVNSDFEEISKYISNADGRTYDIYYSGNYLNAKYKSDEDGFMIMSIPFDKGWNILVDGDAVKYYNCNGGFIGFAVEQGVHEISMSFIPRGFKLGLIISVMGTLNFLFMLIKLCFKKKGN